MGIIEFFPCGSEAREGHLALGFERDGEIGSIPKDGLSCSRKSRVNSLDDLESGHDFFDVRMALGVEISRLHLGVDGDLARVVKSQCQSEIAPCFREIVFEYFDASAKIDPGLEDSPQINLVTFRR